MFQGDPKLRLTPDGVTLDFSGGQPAMDTEKENVVLISLLTERGWVGNYLMDDPAQHIGADVIAMAKKPITKSNLNRVRMAAASALESDVLGVVDVAVSNPSGHRVNIDVNVHGKPFLLSL